MVNRALRAIGVVYLQAIALTDDIIAYGLEAVGRFASEQSNWSIISVDTLAYEVVCAVVSDFEDYIGDNVGDGYEIA